MNRRKPLLWSYERRTQVLVKGFRELMLGTITRMTENNRSLPIALALSGGVDSLVVLFSMLECGLTVRPYTYAFANISSADLEMATKVCKAFGLTDVHHVVTIPSDKDSLLTEIRYLVNMGPMRVAVLQNLHGLDYMTRKMNQDLLLLGYGGDSLAGTLRDMAIRGGRRDRAVFDQARLDDIKRSDEMKWFAKVCPPGIRFIPVFEDKGLEKFFMSLDYAQINFPRQKALHVEAFNDYFSRVDCYRQHVSAQLVSGAKRLHEGLLSDSTVNVTGVQHIRRFYKQFRTGFGKTNG